MVFEQNLFFVSQYFAFVIHILTQKATSVYSSAQLILCVIDLPELFFELYCMTLTTD